ncbi:DNA repair protein rad2 [Vanrija albida]|uniref:DNA repair protein rad2 n=1 Tax=Vanrija albida TaxID=181172 RepID=A0ABR3QAG8_9TREE
MGVKGLWSLLNPVARPVQIESLEGKRLAIDSSIWLYQDGRVLVNAHILGFLRRINKLLFHGIKPVFVFDGGAPVLKRSTIAERKRKKAGAAVNHTKMAEKLLQAQLRREALRVTHEAEQARASRIAARSTWDDDGGEEMPENVTYLDELERPSSSRPKKAVAKTPAGGEATAEERRKKFKKHDRYYLPDADMPQFSTDDRPDARLATEAELQQFIDELNPEDIDVESAEFRALPTEVQYEIIGDLRLRSRQQSHQRLQDMLRGAPTPLDFSKAQIRGVAQRNALTQQLLTVTDMVGKAHLTIPVRVAAERNREYVLVKRGEQDGGGWALGIREGTKEKPIVLEPESNGLKDEVSDEESGSEDEYSDIEERQEILQAIVHRYAPGPTKKPEDDVVKSFGKARPAGAQPLFDLGDEEDIVPTANDEALALALQQEELGSDEDEPDADLARALALSRREAAQAKPAPAAPVADAADSDEDDFEEVSLVPSGNTTPIAGSSAHTPVPIEDSDEDDDLVEVTGEQIPAPAPPPKNDPQKLDALVTESIRASTPDSTSAGSGQGQPALVVDDDSEEDEFEEVGTGVASAVAPTPAVRPHRPALSQASSRPKPPLKTDVRRDSIPIVPSKLSRTVIPETVSSSPSPPPAEEIDEVTRPAHSPSPDLRRGRGAPSPSPPRSYPPSQAADDEGGSDWNDEPTQLNEAAPTRRQDDEDDDDEPIPWSRSPSPVRRIKHVDSSLGTLADTSMQSMQSAGSEPEGEDDDEMHPEDMVVEEDDYARFLASIQNRDLNDVREELDDEIRILNMQTKAAMRDSDEITQAMIVQIQTLLRHFGIPYITAPMEAEAQCAKLAEIGLVDGIITDDSDVFLFGGTQCFKNIFNDAKFAECFLATDVERELSLTRERLISLAYLLGSDYTLGLPGVGPVLALELLVNFPGPNGLQKFKEWWLKVQVGTDLPVEADTKWKRSFKKRFANSIQLSADWPNMHVREAYLYPTADESDEPFHWGFPRLAALRSFLHEELSWSISKVDDELTPIVQRIAKRGRGGVAKQGTLLPFFDHGAGTGTSFAPRRRTTANVSKRLLSVIKEFREAEARTQGQQPEGWGEMLAGVDEEDPAGRGTGKRKSGEGKAAAKRKSVADGAEDGDEPQAQKKGRKGAAAAAATTTSEAESSSASEKRPRRRK